MFCIALLQPKPCELLSSNHPNLINSQVMALNVTCPHGNSTTECLVSIRSPLGLSVGLPVFSLLLGIVIALMVYTQRSKLRNMLQLGKLKTTEDNLHKQEISQYTGMIRSQSTEQSPIYENFTECTKIDVDMNR